MDKLKIKIILASIRNNRFGDKPANWISALAEQMPEFSVEILDLKDYQFPLFAEAISPAQVEGSYGKPEVDKWAGKIAEADGFIFVIPEYNHGCPPSLINNLDYIYKEWNKKPMCVVSYGGVGGARAVEQLRTIVIEQQMVPLRNSVNIMNPWMLSEMDNSLKAGALDGYVKTAQNMLVQLFWWANVLKEARNKK